jgi:hypothetical protein
MLTDNSCVGRVTMSSRERCLRWTVSGIAFLWQLLGSPNSSSGLNT